jgi:hypothetical protein
MTDAVRIAAIRKRTTAIPRSVSCQRTGAVAGRALPGAGPNLSWTGGMETGGIETGGIARRGIETGGIKIGTALIV